MKKPFSRFISCILGLFFLVSFSITADAQVTYLQGKEAAKKLSVAIDTELNNLKNGVYTSVDQQTAVAQLVAFYKQVNEGIAKDYATSNTDEVISTTVPTYWYQLSDSGINGPIGMLAQPTDNPVITLDELKLETRTLLVN